MLHSFVNYCFDLIFSNFTTQNIKNTAHEIAQQHQIECMERFNSISLPPDQMRGYVRAYIRSFTDSVVKKHLQDKHLSTKQISKITLVVKELLIEMAKHNTLSTSSATREKIAVAA